MLNIISFSFCSKNTYLKKPVFKILICLIFIKKKKKKKKDVKHILQILLYIFCIGPGWLNELGSWIT
jgi:hypothetical protein